MVLIPLFLYSWCVQEATEIDVGKRKHTHPPFSLGTNSCLFCCIYSSPKTAQQKPNMPGFPILFLRHVITWDFVPSVSHTFQTPQHKEFQNFLIVLFAQQNIIVIPSVINIPEYFKKLFYLSFSLQVPDLRAQQKACSLHSVDHCNFLVFQLNSDWLLTD